MKQPFEIIDISNKSNLYGRDALLRKLTILAKRCENASIIGARRFGKTCLLKSIITDIKLSNDIKSQTLKAPKKDKNKKKSCC
jgi:ABC-type transporter Mla maintaining outer membrane lipid asymmetry ATPase subunit MlaF